MNRVKETNKNELSGLQPCPFLFVFWPLCCLWYGSHDSPCPFPGCICLNLSVVSSFFLSVSSPGHFHSSLLQCPPFSEQHLSWKLMVHSFIFLLFPALCRWLRFSSAHLWGPNSLPWSSIFLQVLSQVCRIESIFKPSLFSFFSSTEGGWTLCLVLAKQKLCHSSHSTSPFYLGCFWSRVLLYA